jgi:hypothetical protein
MALDFFIVSVIELVYYAVFYKHIIDPCFIKCTEIEFQFNMQKEGMAITMFD